MDAVEVSHGPGHPRHQRKIAQARARHLILPCSVWQMLKQQLSLEDSCRTGNDVVQDRDVLVKR